MFPYQVLNAKHVPYYLLFTCAGALILVATGDITRESLVTNILAITITWSLIRMCGILGNSFDDINIFSMIGQSSGTCL